MTSFQSSELTELPVVENSQLFAQRTHSACTARAQRTVRPHWSGRGVGGGVGGEVDPGAAMGQVWTRHCRSSRACPTAFIALSVHHVFVRPLALLVFHTVPCPCLPGWGKSCGPQVLGFTAWGHCTHDTESGSWRSMFGWTRGGWGLTLLLENCCLKGFGTGKHFTAGGLWMVAVDSWWPLDKALYRSLRLLTASQSCGPKKLQGRRVWIRGGGVLLPFFLF